MNPELGGESLQVILVGIDFIEHFSKLSLQLSPLQQHILLPSTVLPQDFSIPSFLSKQD